MRFWVGGYTPRWEGEAEGISVLRAGEAESPWASGQLSAGPLAVAAPGSPSWLAAHPSLDVLYAGLEADGTVQAYRRTGESALAPLGAPVEAGSAVCHVTVSPDGAFLLASCWGDGRVVRVALDAAGRPSSPWIAPAASDPHDPAQPGAESAVLLRSGTAVPDLAAAARALREAAGEEFAHLVPDHDHDRAEPAPAAADEARPSRAHQSVFVGDGLMATTDLGLDLVRFWRPAPGTLRLVQQLALPKGSGPRHLLTHPSGHLYVLTEFSCEVFALAPDAEGRWHLVSGVSLEGTSEGDTGAEIAMSRDGETLYAGVRGTDTIGVVRVRGAGETLHQGALVESGTRWPRHHAVVRDTLLVAGERANEVVSLPLDGRTGVPGRVRHRVAVPSPSHLLPTR